jgi:Tfp pilus assembly protein PilW
MNARQQPIRARQRGVGLMEVMISIVIGMLLVLVIYQVYEISEGQKRTITSGSDAQQNASYGLYALGRELAMAGNGIASVGETLDTCAAFSPVPVLINRVRTTARLTPSPSSTAAQVRCRRRLRFVARLPPVISTSWPGLSASARMT